MADLNMRGLLLCRRGLLVFPAALLCPSDDEVVDDTDELSLDNAGVTLFCSR